MLYKADLHIHTVLSPCGDVEMSPFNIVTTALDRQLDMIAVTDHNSTRQCRSVLQMAKGKSLEVLLGVEVTSKEEVHCLAYFETLAYMDEFQQYLDKYLPNIKNDVDRFGYQVVVDENEAIIYEEEKLLITGIEQSVEQIADKVHELNGIFIPAHIDKPKYSLLSQLGFIPLDIKADAFELSKHADKKQLLEQHSMLNEKFLFQNSDAHIPEHIGTSFTMLDMDTPDFQGLKKMLSSFVLL